MEHLCTKVPYPTKKAAKQHLREITKKKQKHNKPCRTYECEFCGFWHLTSRPSSKYKTIENEVFNGFKFLKTSKKQIKQNRNQN